MSFLLRDVTINVLIIFCQIPGMRNLAFSLCDVTINLSFVFHIRFTLHLLLFVRNFDLLEVRHNLTVARPHSYGVLLQTVIERTNVVCCRLIRFKSDKSLPQNLIIYTKDKPRGTQFTFSLNVYSKNWGLYKSKETYCSIKHNLTVPCKI